MNLLFALSEPMLQNLAAASPDLLPDISFDTFRKIVDVIDAHAFDINLNANDKLVALFPSATLLQTSCAPNVRLSFLIEPTSADASNDRKLGRVVVRAAREIAK